MYNMREKIKIEEKVSDRISFVNIDIGSITISKEETRKIRKELNELERIARADIRKVVSESFENGISSYIIY